MEPGIVIVKDDNYQFRDTYKGWKPELFSFSSRRDVYRLPIRDGNQYIPRSSWPVSGVYRLPIRDGNVGYPHQPLVGGPVYRLPIRDGNSSARMGSPPLPTPFIDYL